MLQTLESALAGLNPLAVLERGYSITLDGKGRIVKSAATLEIGQPIDILLARGKVRAGVQEIEPSRGPIPRKAEPD